MSEYRRLKIVWSNRTGELASAYAHSEADASDVLRRMIDRTPLCDGDTFTVTDVGATGE